MLWIHTCSKAKEKNKGCHDFNLGISTSLMSLKMSTAFTDNFFVPICYISTTLILKIAPYFYNSYVLAPAIRHPSEINTANSCGIRGSASSIIY